MEENQQDLFRKIRAGSFEFYEEDWDKISQDAKDLISQLLVVDPKRRMGVDEALRSRWITQDAEFLSSKDLSDSLRVIKDKRHRLRNFATAVLWANNKHNSEPIPREIMDSVGSNAAHISGLDDEQA